MGGTISSHVEKVEGDDGTVAGGNNSTLPAKGCVVCTEEGGVMSVKVSAICWRSWGENVRGE